MVLCRIYKSSPPISIIIETNSIHITPSHHYKIDPKIIRPPTSWSSYWPPSLWLSHQQSIRVPLLSSPIRVTYPAHLIFLNYIIVIILGQEYKSSSSTLYSFLHSPVTSSLFGLNILLSSLFSNSLSLCTYLNVRGPCRTKC
jgi:hypothetical protein